MVGALAKILPYRRVTLVSKVSPEQIRARLEAQTTPEEFFFSRPCFFRCTHPPYEGRIDADRFRLRPHLRRGGNRSGPIIRGTILPDDDTGSVIRMSLRMPLFPVVFISVWLSGVAAATVLILVDHVRYGRVTPAPLLSAAMFAFGYWMTFGAFHRQSKRITLALTQLFDAAPPPPGALLGPGSSRARRTSMPT